MLLSVSPSVPIKTILSFSFIFFLLLQKKTVLNSLHPSINRWTLPTTTTTTCSTSFSYFTTTTLPWSDQISSYSKITWYFYFFTIVAAASTTITTVVASTPPFFPFFFLPLSPCHQMGKRQLWACKCYHSDSACFSFGSLFHFQFNLIMVSFAET